jgi:MscS family membrane protein
MKKILEQIVLDNSVKSYLFVALAIFIGLLLKRVISKYIARLLFRFVGKAGKSVARESFLELVVEPLDYFLILLIAIISLDKLTYPALLNITVYRISLRQLIDALADGVVIVVFIWLVRRLIDFVALILEEKANLTSDQTDNQLIIFFKDFFKAIVVIIGVLMIIRFSFNKDISSVLTGLSIVGAAIALATRESMENLIASFIIFFDKPFTVGDLVKVNGFSGTVEKIGLRSTRIRTLEKTFISVPNKQMVDTIVDNISLRTQRKVELKVEIDINASSQSIADLLAVIKEKLVLPFVQNPQVHLVDTGKNAHVISLEYFGSMDETMDQFLNHREEVYLMVIASIEENKLQLAGASTDIVIKENKLNY